MLYFIPQTITGSCSPFSIWLNNRVMHFIILTFTFWRRRRAALTMTLIHGKLTSSFVWSLRYARCLSEPYRSYRIIEWYWQIDFYNPIGCPCIRTCLSIQSSPVKWSYWLFFRCLFFFFHFLSRSFLPNIPFCVTNAKCKTTEQIIKPRVSLWRFSQALCEVHFSLN